MAVIETSAHLTAAPPAWGAQSCVPAGRGVC